MSIGYACLTIGVQETRFKSCIAKNVNKENLLNLISYNLQSLENIIDYNIKENLKLFRISSDLIPFGSSKLNDLRWEEIFSDKLAKIGNKIRENGIRVSMHPGQYTVINSPTIDVVCRAIDDLNYHAKVLDSLKVGIENKIVLHIGGIYNDKELAIKRFITNYGKLSDSVKQRLVIENDDKCYNIKDVLEIGKALRIPVIFDNLHNEINSYNGEKSSIEWIKKCKGTWRKQDGNQKIHYSQQNPLKKSGSHSNTIRIKEFVDFYKDLDREDIDIMLEVKDKNLSAVKCINAITKEKNIKNLEVEWSRYKYTILEYSPNIYLEIRKLLKDKEQYPVFEFYNFIEVAMENEITKGNAINALTHVWGYFKKVAEEKEKNIFLKSIEDYKQGKKSLATIKNILFKMAVKYDESYILNSYYCQLL
jgi:UV DNA damage endonuclease